MPIECDWIDGDLQNVRHPFSFDTPPDERKRLVRVGDLVKIGLRFHADGRPVNHYFHDGSLGERFWVEITKAEWPWFEGRIDCEDLRYTEHHGLKDGLFVGFEARHILSVDDLCEVPT